MRVEHEVEVDADLTSEYIAHRYGVSARTLQFYEEKGLLSPKQVGAVRLFSAQDVVRLEVVLAGKKLGLALSEIAEIIRCHEARPKTARNEGPTQDFVSMERRLSLLETQKTEIEAAISKLNAHLISHERKTTDD